MRSATIVVLGVVACGAAALLAVGSTERRELAFTLGVAPNTPIPVKPGHELCQGEIDAPDDFDAVRLQVGTFMRRGSSFSVVLRGPSGEQLAEGSVRSGYADNAVLTVPVGRLTSGSRFDLCIENAGTRAIAPYGGPALASPSTEGTLDGEASQQDMGADFVRMESVSLLSLAPEMAERASLFHGSWVGPWTIWLVGLLVLAGVPLLLALALRATVR
jgi:hypothetical protein